VVRGRGCRRAGRLDPTAQAQGNGSTINSDPPKLVDLRTAPELTSAPRPANLAINLPTMPMADYLAAKAAAAARAPSGARHGAAPSSATDVTLYTQVAGANQTQSGGAFPPDGDIATSAQWLVQVVSDLVIMYNWNTNAFKQVSLATFFQDSTNVLFDPRVIYDPYWDRFVVLAAGRSPSGVLNPLWLGVSQTGDPSAAWLTYRLSLGGTFDVADFPQLGMDLNSIIITYNDFGSKILALAKTYLYTGNSLAFIVPTLSGPACTVAPPYVIDDGGVAYLMMFCPSDTKVYIGSLSSSGLSTASLTWDSGVAVSHHDVPPNAPQPGVDYPLDTGDNRFENRSIQVGNRILNVATTNYLGFATPGLYAFNTATIPHSLVSEGVWFASSTSSDWHPSINANTLGATAGTPLGEIFATWMSVDVPSNVNVQLRAVGGLGDNLAGFGSGIPVYTSPLPLTNQTDSSGVHRTGEYGYIALYPAAALGCQAGEVGILDGETAAATAGLWGTRVGIVKHCTTPGDAAPGLAASTPTPRAQDSGPRVGSGPAKSVDLKTAAALPAAPRPAGLAINRPTMPMADYLAAKNVAAAGVPSSAQAAAAPPSTSDVSLYTQVAGPNQTQAGGAFPPDGDIATSGQWMVQVVQNLVTMYNWNTNALKQVSLATFFQDSTDFLFDRRVVYDPYWDRFVVLADACNPCSGGTGVFALAISRTGDPTGAWWNYSVPVTAAGDFADFPQLGMDLNSIIFTFNDFPAGGGVDGRTFAVAKAYLYNGKTFGVTEFGGIGCTVAPPYVLDNSGVDYLLAFCPGDTKVYINSLINTGLSNVSLSVNTVAVPYHGIPPQAPQPGLNYQLDTGDNRFENRSVQNGSRLLNVATVNGVGFAAPAWFVFNTGVSPSLANVGLWAASLYSSDWHASINANTLGSSASSPLGEIFGTWMSVDATNNVNVQLRAIGGTGDNVGRGAGIPVYTSPLPLTNQTDGVGRHRTGDYSYVAVYPAAALGCQVGEIGILDGEAAAATAGRWSTRIGIVKHC
jgi:hypothetical protein